MPLCPPTNGDKGSNLWFPEVFRAQDGTQAAGPDILFSLQGVVGHGPWIPAEPGGGCVVVYMMA